MSIRHEPNDQTAKNQLLFEVAPVGAIHFDDNGVITACNDAFVTVIGSSREKLIGLNMLTLPNKEVVAAVKLALQGTIGSFSGYYTSVTANKTTPVKALFLPFKNDQGIYRGGIGIIEDITSQEEASAEIAKKQAYFEKLFQSSPEGIIILDVNDHIIRCNDRFSEMFEYSIEEIAGKAINDIIVPDHLKEEGLELTALAASGNIIGRETKRMTKSGKLIDVSILARPITLQGGKVALYGIYRDIQERKKIEKELIKSKDKAEHSDRLKTAFLNNLSHEIRTPMNAILGFSNILKNRVNDPDDLDHITNIIIQSSEQLLSMIDAIVRISAIETGLLEVHEVPCDIKEILHKVFQRFQEKANNKNIKFRHHAMLPAGSTKVIADESKLIYALTTFVDNALKFTSKG